MDTEKHMEVAAAVAGAVDALKAIESAVELKAQTGRLRGLLTAQELDEITVNCVKALRLHNQRLKEFL